MNTVTLGIDLASQSQKTAICALEWSPTSVVVRALAVGKHDGTPLHDKFVITTIAGMRQIGQGERPIVKAGIDAPFGWPDPFVEALNAHHLGAGWPSGMDNPRSPYYWRETDDWVRREWHKTPLSVSTDKIAVVAMRCGVILEDLAVKCGPAATERTGRGLVCEVYPDPALRFWTDGDPSSLGNKESYKETATVQRRHELLGIICRRLGLEDPSNLLPLAAENDHGLDALVSALVARAAWLGRTQEPPISERIDREGWIHLPTVPLGSLKGSV